MKRETWQLPENRDLIDWQLPPMRCFQVSVPDHPDAITAFYDSWHQLTRWTSWQRDNDKFGAVVAAAFRLGAPSPCEESEDMSDIADAIRYLADTLELNVSQQQEQNMYGSGGGGGGSCLPDPLAPLPTQLDGDDSHQIFPTIPNEATDAVALEYNYLCAVSAYLADSWEAMQIALNEQWQVVGTAAATIIALLQEKFPGGMIVPFIASIISQLLVLGEIAYLAGILERAAESATEQKTQLREAVRGANSPLDAKRRWESVIADNRASRGRVVAGLLHLQSQLLDWDKIMGGDVNVPAEYYEQCETVVLNGGFSLVQGLPVAWLPGGGTGIASQSAEIVGNSFVCQSVVASGAARTGSHLMAFVPAAEGNYRVVGARWHVLPLGVSTSALMSEWAGGEYPRIVAAGSSEIVRGYSPVIIRSDAGIKTAFQAANPVAPFPVLWTTAMIPAATITLPPATTFAIRGNHVIPANLTGEATYRLMFLIQEIV